MSIFDEKTTKAPLLGLKRKLKGGEDKEKNIIVDE